MTNDWVVDDARAEDAPEMARLFGKVLPPELNDLCIWGSPKLHRYLAETVDHCYADAARRLFVLRRGHVLGGAISLREIDDQLWIDNVYVEPELRRLMLGNFLIADAVERLHTSSSFDHVGWDCVIGREPREEAWHKRLGGVEESRAGWWISGLLSFSVRPGTPAGQVEGLAKADREHGEWGFSSFMVRTVHGSFRVDRLHCQYFRLTDASAAADVDLLKTLCALDESRRLALIGPEDFSESGWARVAVSKRLKAPIGVFLRHLRAMVALAGHKGR